MDAYNDSTTNKRKLLIPLVVLMLCSVALTGAAYAYTASLEGGNGDVDPEFITIYLGSTDKIIEFETTDKIEFNASVAKVDDVVTTTYSVASDGNTAKFLVYVFGEGTPSAGIAPTLTIGACTTNISGLSVTATPGTFTAASEGGYLGTFEVTLTFATAEPLTAEPGTITVTLGTLTATQAHTA